MRRIFCVIMLVGTVSILFPVALFAATGKSIPFFRSPTSPFPSGQETRSTLLKSETLRAEGQELIFETLPRADGKKSQRRYTLPAESVVSDIHVSLWVQAKGELLVFSQMSALAPTIFKTTSAEGLQVLQVQKEWAEVSSPRLQKRGFVPWIQLKANYHDRGLNYLIIDAPLKSAPAFSSSMLLTIPAGTRVQALREQEDWLQVQYQNKIGYINKSSTLTKLDFAISVADKKNNWLPLRPEIPLNQQQRPLADFQGILTDPTRVIVSRAFEDLNIHQRLKLIKKSANLWIQSRLPDHGFVWWKKSDLDLIEQAAKEEEELSLDQLLTREIYSVSFDPKNAHRGLVSSHGIYSTMNGTHWKKIALFDDLDLPVHIHSDGTWFIGGYRSDDQGKTFKEYLQWDKLTRILQAAISESPRFVKMVSLQSVDKNNLEMILDTGGRRIHLLSMNNGTSWLYSKQ